MKPAEEETARKTQIGMIYALLDRLKISELKDDFVFQFTDMRTTHTKEMTLKEASNLIVHLREEMDAKVRPIRGKIIHYLCLYGMTLADQKPDYKRINDFVQKIGARNPHKRVLFDLWPDEAVQVLNQVEAMVKKTLKKKDNS